MLEVQRNRGAKHREEIDFTRKLMWGHMIFGAAVVSIFLFHEIFRWFVGALLWYALSLAVMHGFMNGQKCCRWLLALVFLVGAGAGLFFITRVFPGIPPPPPPHLFHALVPVWLGLANLSYVTGALLLLFDPRIRRAAKVLHTEVKPAVRKGQGTAAENNSAKEGHSSAR